MHAKDVIRLTIEGSENITNAYLDDLSDTDLMLRPVEGMNHIAWQLGHLIESERNMVEQIRPGSCPPLPEGFDQAHSKDAASSDDPRKFRTKADYLRTWKAQRAATLAVLADLSDEQLAQPTGISYAPTVAAMINMVGAHVLMHVGQFVAVRRKLHKPITI